MVYHVPMRSTTFIPPFLLSALLVAAAPAAADDSAQAERVAVGQEAPEVSLTGIDGETYASSTLEGEKPLVLVFFRGSW